MSSSGRDIWKLLQEELRTGVPRGFPEQTEDTTKSSSLLSRADQKEAFVFFGGSRGCGKSTLAAQFVNPTKDETPKPTVALDYTFARRTNPATNSRDVSHVWELGGGTKLSDLIQVVITPQRLKTNVICICVDLSHPWSAVDMALQWMSLIRSRVDECLNKLKIKDKTAYSAIIKANKTRLGLPLSSKQAIQQETNSSRPSTATEQSDTTTSSTKDNQPASNTFHVDAQRVNPIMVPILLLGTKHDIFRNYEGPQRKPVLQALRYLAHVHGASFLCVSQREKALLGMYRNILSHQVFNTQLKKLSALDPSSAVMVPASMDSLESIGAPPGLSMHDLDASNTNEGFLRVIDAWRTAIAQVWTTTHIQSAKSKLPVSTTSENDPDIDEENSTDKMPEPSMFPEPAVDEMCAQKEEELARYVKDAERRLKLEARAAAQNEKATAAVLGVPVKSKESSSKSSSKRHHKSSKNKHNS